jgi:inhibitor of Bruton tyrosine kinase
MNSPLHVHFINRNHRAFRALLDSSRPANTSSPAASSSSLSRSWQSSSGSSRPADSTGVVDVNARDHLGRTVLHLAAASVHPSTVDFVRSLLAHPSININLQDLESHWTALHRALWAGNLPIAIILLQRQDIDTSLKDFEGYTAFDLYNSSVEHTHPTSSSGMDLFVWGSNRNAALGLGDAGDRSFPEHVNLPALDPSTIFSKSSTTYVRSIKMARLHTSMLHIVSLLCHLNFILSIVAVTSEPRANLRACGFGSGGRLGPNQHTQYTFSNLSHTSHLAIKDVALGQDHTLAITFTGELYSWGLNRFNQLGYVIEAKPPSSVNPSSGHEELNIQSTARKVYGPLKKELVVGAAASKIASACWTSTELYTWGTNRGQLGECSLTSPHDLNS